MRKIRLMAPVRVLLLATLCVIGCSSNTGTPPAAIAPRSGDAPPAPQDEPVAATEKIADVRQTDAWRRASGLSREGRYTEAAQAFGALAKAHPNISVAHREYAWVLAQIGRLDDALLEASKAVEVDDRDAGAHYIHGWILVDHERYPDAITSYKEALALDSSIPDIHFELGRTLGIMAMQKEERPAEVDEAIEHVKHAIHLDSTKANYHDELGNLLGMSWRFEEAVTALRVAVRLAPANANLWHNLAGQQVNAGQFDAADVSFGRAAELDPPRTQRPDFKECWAAAKAKRHC